MQKPILDFLHKLYQVLDCLYEDKARTLVQKKHTELSPTYYRNKLGVYDVTDTKRKKYTTKEIHMFLFCVLFSQNTSDSYTLSTTEKIHPVLELCSEEVQVVIETLSPYFYKHREANTRALRQLGVLVCHSLTKNTMVSIDDLIQVPRVGYKTASIVYNHFFDADKYPVVDVNVFRAYNDLAKTKSKRPDELYFHLLEYSNLELLKDRFNRGYDLANLLWYHRKLCRAKKCSANFCGNCRFLKQLLDDSESLSEDK